VSTYRAVLRCGHRVDVGEDHARSLVEDNCHDGVFCTACMSTRTISHILNWSNGGHWHERGHVDAAGELTTD
jgi:hypothetical protein